MCLRSDYFLAEAENRALTGRANTADSIFASECEECGSSACICQFEVEVERPREDLTVTLPPVS